MKIRKEYQKLIKRKRKNLNENGQIEDTSESEDSRLQYAKGKNLKKKRKKLTQEEILDIMKQDEKEEAKRKGRKAHFSPMQKELPFKHREPEGKYDKHSSRPYSLGYEDEIYQKYEVLSDSFAELKKPLKECDKKLAALRIMTKRMDEEESKYNDKFHIDQDGNRRLIAGECYHYLFYHICVDGKVVNHREKVLTWIRDENGKYLLERNNGEQFWIGYDNLGWEADLYDV